MANPSDIPGGGSRARQKRLALIFGILGLVTGMLGLIALLMGLRWIDAGFLATSIVATVAAITALRRKSRRTSGRTDPPSSSGPSPRVAHCHHCNESVPGKSHSGLCSTCDMARRVWGLPEGERPDEPTPDSCYAIICRKPGKNWLFQPLVFTPFKGTKVTVTSEGGVAPLCKHIGCGVLEEVNGLWYWRSEEDEGPVVLPEGRLTRIRNVDVLISHQPGTTNLTPSTFTMISKGAGPRELSYSLGSEDWGRGPFLNVSCSQGLLWYRVRHGHPGSFYQHPGVEYHAIAQPSVEDWQALDDCMKRVGAGSWDENYHSVTDVLSWSFRIKWDRRQVATTGDVRRPEGLDDVLHLLESFLGGRKVQPVPWIEGPWVKLAS